MPNLSWESSVSLLFTAATVSIILIIMITVVCVIPGLFWLSIIVRNKYTKFLLLGKDGRPKGFIRLSLSAILLLVSPFFFINSVISGYNFTHIIIGLLLVFIALYLPYDVIKTSRILLILAKNKGILYLEKNKEDKNHLNKVLVSIRVLSVSHDAKFKRKNQNKNFKIFLKFWLFITDIFKLILTGLCSSLILMILPVAYIFITGMGRIQALQNQGEHNLLFVFIFFYSVAIISNKIITRVCFGKKSLTKYTEAFIIGFSVFFLISIVFSSFAELPKMVMNGFGWGNIQKASIVVNKEGCSILEAMDIKVNGDCSNKSNVYKVDDVDILLSLGENFVVRRHFDIEDKKAKKKVPQNTITLPKKLVLSWARPQYRE